jgi:hypothetical protein
MTNAECLLSEVKRTLSGHLYISFLYTSVVALIWREQTCLKMSVFAAAHMPPTLKKIRKKFGHARESKTLLALSGFLAVAAMTRRVGGKAPTI